MKSPIFCFLTEANGINARGLSVSCCHCNPWSIPSDCLNRGSSSTTTGFKHISTWWDKNHGKPWENHGKTMGNHRKPWENHGETMGKPWGNHGETMGNHGKPWGNHGKPWKTMGKPWETMENHGKTMGKPWENHGKPWENHGETMGKPWKTMGKPWGNHGENPQENHPSLEKPWRKKTWKKRLGDFCLKNQADDLDGRSRGSSYLRTYH